MNNLTLTVDEQGIATITFDVPGKSMNVLSAAVLADFAAAVEQSVADAAVRGILITSAKPSFVPGADLTELVQQFERKRELPQAVADNVSFSKLLRRLETCGKPVAAAINGVRASIASLESARSTLSTASTALPYRLSALAGRGTLRLQPAQRAITSCT